MASARTYDIPGDVTDIQPASRPEVPEAPIRLSSRCTKKNPRPRPGAFAVQNTLALTLLATLAALALSALTTLLAALATLTALPAALVRVHPVGHIDSAGHASVRRRSYLLLQFPPCRDNKRVEVRSLQAARSP